MKAWHLSLDESMFMNNVIDLVGGVMKNVLSASVGTRSYLSDEQHEPPNIEVSVSIARLDSSSSPYCSLVFHIC